MRVRYSDICGIGFAIVTWACSGTVFTGGTESGGGSSAGGAAPQGGASGVSCGPTVCGADQICCDASCGICGAANGICPAIACAPGTGGSRGTGGAAATGGAASVCGQDCASSGFVCCSGTCRNMDNDPANCGACGNACLSDKPICMAGQCKNLSCSAELGPPGTVCCGATWCAAGQLCCQVAGPVVSDTPQCVNTSDGTCPRGCKLCVCANPATPIETPDGARPISELKVGDLVYSVEHDTIVPSPIVEIRRRPAKGHVVPQVAFSNGQIVQISGQHPTADGRTFAQLQAGDMLGSLSVTSVEWVTYEQPYTYDILPATDTGYYFAAGAMIGSTLKLSQVKNPYVQPPQEISRLR